MTYLNTNELSAPLVQILKDEVKNRYLNGESLEEISYIFNIQRKIALFYLGNSDVGYICKN